MLMERATRAWLVRRGVPCVCVLVLQSRRRLPFPSTKWKRKGRNGRTERERTTRAVGRSGGPRMESRQSRIVCSGKPTANLICTLQLTDPGLP